MKRIVELDIIKALAIIMVVIGHTACPTIIGQMFYLIHVPLFFMVSSYTCKDDSEFCSKSSLRIFFLKRIRTLYVPFLKYVLPVVLLHNVFYEIGVYDTPYTVKEYVFQICRTLLMSVGNNEPLLKQLWFLKVLFLTEIYYAIIIYVANKVGCSKYSILFFFFIFALIIPIETLKHIYIMNFYLPIKAMIFYCMGLFFRNKYPITSMRKRILPIILFVLLWIPSGFFLKTSFQDSDQLVAIFQLILTVFAFYAVSVFPLAVLPVALQKRLQKMGKRTMIIFCWHYIAFLLLSSIYIFLTNGDLHLIAKTLRIPNISWWCFSIFGIFIPYYIYSFKSYVIINSNFSESAK